MLQCEYLCVCVCVCLCVCVLRQPLYLSRVNCVWRYLVRLLGGGSVLLGVLVGLQQQVHQSLDGPCVPQRRLIGWAQCQVTDQTNCSLCVCVCV